ncbi:hypothetical protein Tco_1478981, partial [Tanacetum coccineum]
IWLFHLGIRGIHILGLRDYSKLMLISQILRRDWVGYTDADRAHGCSGIEFGEAILDLDTTRALQF